MREPPRAVHRTVLSLIIIVIVLVAGLLPALPAEAQSVFSTPIMSIAGVVKGTAVLAPTGTGAMIVDLNVSGFDPVAGSHRFVITNTGICCPPDFRRCAGQAIAVLPEVQFNADGSASYHVVTGAISFASLTGRFGSALLLYANSDPQSDVVACGVIVPPFAVPPPYPTPPPVVPPPTGPTAIVTARLGLNLRQGPGLAQPRILALSIGESVSLTGERAFADGIEWVRVVAFRGGQNYVGWAAATYLSGAGGTPAPSPGANVRVTAQAGLRLRSGPGLGFVIQRIVPYGTLLRTTGARQAADGYVWAQIMIDGLTFWAADAFLTPV